MKLSSKALYAVRAMFDMAYHGTGQPSKIEDIARRQSVPPRFLEQIFQELKKAGLVRSKRGPRGGYVLRDEPENITIGAIVRAVEGPIEDGLCYKAGDVEKNPGLCVTARLWKELAAQIDEVLDAVTLQELVLRGETEGVEREGYHEFVYVI